MHLSDAKAIRECLHEIALAISSLEMLADSDSNRQIAGQARQALHEIAVLVNVDEDIEHGLNPPIPLEKEREDILRGQSTGTDGAVRPLKRAA